MTEQTERQLSELVLNTNGSHRAKAERLFRCMLRVIGVADVPWYPDRDEAVGVTMPEEEEWLMEQSDVESEVDTEQRSNIRPPVWPSNKGLPPISEKTTTVTRNQRVQQLMNNSPSASNRTNIQHQEPRPTDNTIIMPRITVNEDGEANSRQYLLPPQPDIRNALASLSVRRDITNLDTTPANASREREGGRDFERLHGARPKETWHRSRLSITAWNLENRDELDDEYVPSDGGFVRVTRQPNLHVTPRRRRRISPPRDSSSSSTDYSPPPLSSSRLQVDFRDLSPGSEEESRGRYTTNRARRPSETTAFRSSRP